MSATKRNNDVTVEQERTVFYQEAMESLQHYQETGLHVTGDEVFAWLESVGTEHELDPPECHT